MHINRMELVWGDVSKTDNIIQKTLAEISSISSHFNQSGMRTAELQTIAKEKGLHLSKLPKLFTIRWTEFSATIVNSMLRSWEALMNYFDKNKSDDSTANGFYLFLSRINNLRVFAFLADLLHIYSRYQKKLQGDNLTIVTLVESINSLLNALSKLKKWLPPRWMGRCA